MQLGVLLPPIFGYDEDRADPVISMPDEITVRIAPEPQMPFVDATAYGAPKYVKSFDDFIGQEAMKRELGVYIDEAIQDGEPFPHTLLASPMPGIGKGHDVDTMLLTPLGWRRIGDLELGNQVIGSNGHATTVTGLYERGSLPLYRVTFSDGSSVRCDGEHLWTVQTPSMCNRAKWTTADTATLMSGPLTDVLGRARYYIPMAAPVEHHQIQATKLPVEPYLAGVMLGNADFAKGVISLNVADRDIADRIVARLRSWWKRVDPATLLSEYPTTTGLRFRPRGANGMLRQLGQENIASKDKFIPAAYLVAPLEHRRELLAGLMDTDGGVRTGRGSAQFHTTSLSLANGVQTLVESLGGTARVRMLKRGEIRVDINILENPFRSQRKSALWKPPSRKPSRSIVSIVPDGEGEVRCIRVDAMDSLYVTERYIVTHNTTLAELIAQELQVRYVKLVPPFSAQALYQAALGMNDCEMLFVDEALALDTPIPTPTGWTTVGAIQPGDAVLGASGSAVIVKRLTPIVTGHNLYDVTFADGSVVRADAGHKWLASPRAKGRTSYLAPRVVTTKEMIDGGTVWRVPLADPIDLPGAELPVDPYVLGQWLGNGNVSQNYINVRPGLVEATIAEFTARGETVTNMGAVGALVRLGLSDVGPGKQKRSSFRVRMEALGIYDQKAIPASYLRGSVAQRQALVQGLMDTDGYLAANGHCTFSNTNEQIIDAMVEVLRTLGYRPVKILTSDVRIGVRGQHRTTWKVEFRGDTAVNPFLLRESDRVIARSHKRELRITSIVEVVSEPVRCIEVDADDHLFLAGTGMVATHNCHKLADQGPRAAENLYHMMEEGVLYLEDGPHRLARFTVMGATTDADKLPEPILDRFMIKPYFQSYNIRELELITENFADFYSIDLDLDVIMGIARACRGTPRVAREMVVGARALGKSLHRPCTLPELLEFKQVEPNGLTRQHIAYLVAMINHFGNRDRDGKISYIAGEATLMSVLRENKTGLSRLERYLIERGLLDRTPRGRRLTDAGVQTALRYKVQEEV